MTAKKSLKLLPLVQSFFEDHLKRNCGRSHHTIRSYRDTLRLLFSFIAGQLGRSVNDLTLDDLHIDSIRDFLNHLEQDRSNSPATRNYRLTAIRSFFKHLVRHDLSRADQYHRVLVLPPKRTRILPAHYLEPEEVKLILQQPDCRTSSGQRDYALLLFLYNTGARVSEALAVRVLDLTLIPPYQVRLEGKGNKVRHCPIWKDTVKSLQRLPSVRNGGRNDQIFLNQNGEPLTRDGVAYILRKHVLRASENKPILRRKNVTPHCLRHSCAAALLQAGVDISVIRDYLGHCSIATTSRYITSNLKMKRTALEVFWKKSGLTSKRSSTWKPKPSLIAFLDSL
jgi:site-specific recombinase XerD